jgi:hypothetical protein
MDALDLGVGEHLVAATLHAGVDGAHVARERRSTQGAAGVTAATAGCWLKIAHAETSVDVVEGSVEANLSTHKRIPLID